MSTTQKAVVLTEVGKPVVLMSDWPIPEPKEDQVQVQVTVAGLNPHDEKIRSGHLKLALPAILTHDVVGKITKLGPGVTTLAVGDRILFQPVFALGEHQVSPQAYAQAGLQEYAVADLVALAKIPDSITDDEACTMVSNLFTSVAALFKTLAIPAPWEPAAQTFDYAKTTLLIIGGGTNCGRFAVQLAKLAGIGSIVVVGGDGAELKTFGANHVVDRHGGEEKVRVRVREIVGDDLIYAYDAINPPETLHLGVNALSNSSKGVLARLIPFGSVDESRVVGKQAGFEVRDVFGSSQVVPELARGFWSRFPEYVTTGLIKPLAYTAKTGLTAENVNEVLDAYRDGKRVTKTHIHL
ncbi:putative alcohol dehydrogenase [Xylariaceae sp. FL0255]|nr:putative alcohol dehydrogenase [Xylariaceae sp. FL0255]